MTKNGLLGILLLCTVFGVENASATPGAISRTEWVKDTLPPLAQDTIPDSSQIKKRSLTAEVNFVSNATFFGRNGNAKFPYYMASLTYKGKSGLWASVSGYHLLNMDSMRFISEANLAAGWDFTISKKVDGSLSYSRFFFASTSPLVKSGTSDLWSGFLGLDWSYLYTTLSCSYIAGTSKDVFISFDNSRYIPIERLFGKNIDLSFEPKFSMVGGTQHFASTFVDQKKYGRQRKIGKRKGSHFNDSSLGLSNIGL